MGAIERLPCVNVQSDAMQGKRVVFPQKSQVRTRNASRAHIIFGMNLKKAKWLRACGNGLKGEARNGRLTR
jgi:hypothetical protein